MWIHIMTRQVYHYSLKKRLALLDGAHWKQNITAHPKCHRHYRGMCTFDLGSHATHNSSNSICVLQLVFVFGVCTLSKILSEKLQESLPLSKANKLPGPPQYHLSTQDCMVKWSKKYHCLVYIKYWRAYFTKYYRIELPTSDCEFTYQNTLQISPLLLHKVKSLPNVANLVYMDLNFMPFFQFHFLAAKLLNNYTCLICAIIIMFWTVLF